MLCINVSSSRRNRLFFAATIAGRMPIHGMNGAVVISRRVLPRVCHLRFADLTPGRYTVSIVGVDRAGNRTPAPPSFELTVP